MQNSLQIWVLKIKVDLNFNMFFILLLAVKSVYIWWK